MNKLEKYLNEARVDKDLTAHVTNKVMDAIKEWSYEKYGDIEGWPTRDKDLYKLADEMMDFFKGMKRSAEQNVKKKTNKIIKSFK